MSLNHEVTNKNFTIIIIFFEFVKTFYVKKLLFGDWSLGN